MLQMVLPEVYTSWWWLYKPPLAESSLSKEVEGGQAEIQNGQNLTQSRQGMPDPRDLDVDSSTMHSFHHEDTVGADSIGSRTEDHDKDVDVHTDLKTLIDTGAGKPLLGQAETLWDKMMSQED